MAQNYRCDLCGEVEADFMVTTIHDGTVIAVGVECLLDWALPIAEAFRAAQEREQADRPGPTSTGGPDVVAGDPMDAMLVAGPSDGPDAPQQEADDGDGGSGGGESPEGPTARKRGRQTPAAGIGSGAETETAPHVAG